VKKVVEEATAVNAAKEAMSMKATDEATTVAGSDSFNDGGPNTASIDTGGGGS
jgi:hypothetical protein